MSEDLIKRSDAIKAIEDARCWLTLASQHGDMGRVLWDEYYIKFEDAIEALLLISSADRPQGKWIANGCAKFSEMCNQCGFVQFKDRVDNFCPHCGAHMKGADDES